MSDVTQYVIGCFETIDPFDRLKWLSLCRRQANCNCAENNGLGYRNEIFII